MLNRLILVAIVAGLVLLAPLAHADETGWQYGVSVSAPSTEPVPWTNPSYVLADANEAVTMNLDSANDYTDFLYVYFDFDVPTDATIDGVSMRYTVRANNGSDMHEGVVQLMVAGVPSGDNKNEHGYFSISATEYTHGGPSDLWGLSLTPAIVNGATFGVAVQCADEGSGSGDDVWIKKIELNITYTPASGGEGEGEGEGDIIGLFFSKLINSTWRLMPCSLY